MFLKVIGWLVFIALIVASGIYMFATNDYSSLWFYSVVFLIGFVFALVKWLGMILLEAKKTNQLLDKIVVLLENQSVEMK